MNATAIQASPGTGVPQHGSEECMGDYVIIVTIAPITNDEPDTTLERTFTIAAHPLTVDFDRLVSALTCSDFSINDETAFRTQVAKTVLTAALSDKKPCSVISNTNGETGNDIPDLAGYNWQIPETSNLILRAAKGEKVDDTTELFRIEFKGKDMGVWVKDADKYNDQSSQDVCNDVKEWIPDAKNYNSYLLNVKVYGHECEGLQGYGNKTEQVLRSLNPTTIIPAYGGSCTLFTTICDYFSQPGFGLGTAVMDAIGCFISPAIGIFNAQRTQSIGTSIGEGFLIGTAIGASPQIAATAKAVLLKWKNMEKAAAAIQKAQSAKAVADEISRIKSLYDAVTKYAPDQIRAWDKLVGDTIKVEHERILIEKMLKGEQIDEKDLKVAREVAAKLADEAGKEVEKIQLRGFAKGIGCSVGGQVLGTVTAYGVVANQIIFPETIDVDIGGINNTANITVSTKKITVGGR
ncbi:hypothetical protein [Thermococcus sp.]